MSQNNGVFFLLQLQRSTGLEMQGIADTLWNNEAAGFVDSNSAIHNGILPSENGIQFR
jgi:hypothetical protein